MFLLIQFLLNTPLNALLRGHVDITGIIATGVNVDPSVSTTINPLIPSTSIDAAVFFSSLDATGANIVVTDSGQFLDTNVNYGLLMSPGTAPFGYTPLPGGYSTTLNTVNYATGVATCYIPSIYVPAGAPINAESQFFQPGMPRGILFYNNTLTIRPPPDISYNIQLQAYLSPAAFLNTSYAIPFGYMAEYIARGAARKILADTGDIEQFQFYEPLFKEQETLVWKRSQRQFTANRTGTIFSDLQGQTNFNQIGAGN